MNGFVHELELLAEGAQQGDGKARAELQQTLEFAMGYIVLRTLQTASCRTTLEKRILAEARRLGIEAPVDQHLIQPMVRNLCAVLVENMVMNSRCRELPRDTVLN